jgi:hypothetical protein
MRTVLVLSCLSIVMCSTASELVAQDETSGHRIFFQGTWKQAQLGRGVVNPASRPELQIADSRAVYVYDYALHQLRALDTAGHVLWTSMGMGGPGPQIGFANPADMKLDQANNLWVNDPYIGMVFVLSNQGVVQRRIPALRSAARIALQRNGGFWLWDEAIRGGGFTTYGPDGTRTGQIPLREAKTGVDTLPPIVRVPWLASGPHADSPVVQTFSWSSDFLLWNSLDHRPVVVHGIEPLNFPVVLSWSIGGQQHLRVPPDANHGALSTVVDDSLIYVLFSGTSKYKARVIDTYLLKNGRYAGSYLLPEPAISMSRLGGQFVTTTTQPNAGVQMWGWVPANKNTNAR